MVPATTNVAGVLLWLGVDTTTEDGPGLKESGTVTVILLSAQTVTAAVTPLNVTEPAVLPKLLPRIVICICVAPEDGNNTEIRGAEFGGALFRPLKLKDGCVNAAVLYVVLAVEVIAELFEPRVMKSIWAPTAWATTGE